MSANSVSMGFEPLREIAFGSISGTYTQIGPNLSPAVRVITFTNMTNVPLNFSINGTDDHFALSPSTSFVLDIAANKTQDRGFFMSANKAIWVKDRGVAAGVGSVVVTTVFGELRSTK